MALAPTVLAASEPIKLQPSSAWVVDYAASSCRVLRTFGQGDNQVKLAIESIVPHQLTMVAMGRPISTTLFGGDVETRFLPIQTKPFFGAAARGESGVGAVFWLAVPFSNDFKFDGRQFSGTGKRGRPPAEPPEATTPTAAELAEAQAFMGNVGDLDFSIPRGSHIALETGPLADVMKLLDDCDRDLLSSIGLDPTVQAQITRLAQPLNLAAWASQIVYPTGGLQRDEEPTVTFRLLIDAAGHPTKCEAFSRYNAPEFDKSVCASLMKVARFSPAELADGTKVPSYAVQNVTFRISNF